jgi:hypothetical protein
VNSGSWANQTVSAGTAATEPAAPTAADFGKPAGFTFKGWYEKTDAGYLPYDFSKPVNADVSLYAFWDSSASAYGLHVTYAPGEGEGSEIIEPYSYAIDTFAKLRPCTFALEGHDFIGWEDASGTLHAPGAFVLMIGDLDLTAIWQVRKHDVSYLYFGDVPLEAPEAPARFSAAFGAQVAIEQPPAVPGYDFVGWQVFGAFGAVSNGQAGFVMPDNDVLISGRFVPVYYKVRFLDWDGKLLKEESVRYGAPATAPAQPVRDGYEFTGWSKGFGCVLSDMDTTAEYKLAESLVEPPDTETPDIDGPGTETPDTETPDTNKPDTETPETETPDAVTPGTETPDPEAPGIDTPDTETPEAGQPGAGNGEDGSATDESGNAGTDEADNGDAPVAPATPPTTAPATPTTPPAPPATTQTPDQPSTPGGQATPAQPAGNGGALTMTVAQQFDADEVDDLESQTGNIIADLANGRTPMGGWNVHGVWSLLSLILSIAALALALLTAVLAAARRNREDGRRNRLPLVIAAIATGILVPAAFLLFDDFANPMAWINGNTVWVALAFLLHLVATTAHLAGIRKASGNRVDTMANMARLAS